MKGGFPWTGRARLGALVGASTGLILALVDIARWFAGPGTVSPVILAAIIVGSLVTAFAGLGLLLGAYVHVAFGPLRNAPERSRAAVWRSSILLALPLASFLVAIPVVWVFDRFPLMSVTGQLVWLLIFIALAGAALLATRVAFLIVELAKPWSGRTALFAGSGIALGTAGVAYFADVSLFQGNYESFHYGLAGATAACTALGVGLALAASGAWRPSVGWLETHVREVRVLGALLALAFVAIALMPPRTFARPRGVVFEKFLRTARFLTDFDGGGSSGLFGGTDCKPFDARTEPSARDIPGNGRDEDCSGRDAAWPEPPLPPEPSTAKERYNVLLVSIDALRADHVSAYGYGRHTTPTIDKLAERSLVFLEAYSQAPGTPDSSTSFHTGAYPSNVPRDYAGVKSDRPHLFRLTDDALPLATMLKRKGYRTGAFVGFKVFETLGVTRDFDEVRYARLTHFARKFIAAGPEPFFAWIHYKHPHMEYEKHPGLEFGDEPIDRYDSEIKRADQELGDVLAELAERRLQRSTIVIVTADHGEEFRDHGGLFHTRKLYRELLHVPLVVKIPKVKAARHTNVVELVDIVPTLAEVLGLEPRPGTLDGVSLLADRGKYGGAYAEDVYHPDTRVGQHAFYDGRHRLIHDRRNDRLELYDVRNDPREQRDLSATEPAILATMREQLAVRSLRSASARRTADRIVLRPPP